MKTLNRLFQNIIDSCNQSVTMLLSMFIFVCAVIVGLLLAIAIIYTMYPYTTFGISSILIISRCFYGMFTGK